MPCPGTCFPPQVAEHWDGQTWRVVRIGYVGDLYGIVALSATNVWAAGGTIGTDQNQDIEHWNGRRWSTTHFWGVESDLTDMAATSPRDVWAVGDILDESGDIAHWDGKRWRFSSPIPRGLVLVGIAAASARSVWAVGWTRKGPGILHYSCR